MRKVIDEKEKHLMAIRARPFRVAIYDERKDFFVGAYVSILLYGV